MDNEQGAMSVGRISGRVAIAATVAAVLLVAFLLSLKTFGTARADTGAVFWAVCPVTGPDCDATSIQAVVDMAGDGDVIRVVGNSTYVENVVITKSLTLLGGCANAACNVRAPGVFVTTIDGGGVGRVVTVEGESDPITATINGFVITGGDADAAVQHANAGGGVGSWNANLVLMRNVITANVASEVTDGYGGGVCAEDSQLIVDQNTIRENAATVAENHIGYGGGVYFHNGEVTLSHNWILSNTASGAGWGQGGGMYAKGGTVTMAADTVMYNRATLDSGAPGEGDGIMLEGVSTMTATNVIIARNQSLSTGPWRSALFMNGASLASTVTLVNSSVISNSKDYEGLCCQGGGGGVHLRVVNSILWGNGDEIAGSYNSLLLAYSDIEDDTDSGTGVIHEDPGFVDPQNDDFHLKSDSPCVDAGAAPDVYSFVPAVDWDGDTRPILQGYDIGPDEAWGEYVYLPLVLKDD